jgi:TonB family protein
MRSERQSVSTRPAVSTPFSADGDPLGIICGWDAPDGGHRVTLSPVLIRELRQAAIQAFLAIPRRGVEIGGLLFGKMRQERLDPGASEAAVFEIAAFEDVPCEHRFGPSYILDELDRTNLAELLARHQRHESPALIGFYRSYTGRDARLDEADQELIRTFFPDGRFACLLLQPLSMEKCAAGFRFWNGGEILPESYASFPFEAAQMDQEKVEPSPAGGAGEPRTYAANTTETTDRESREIQPYLISSALRQTAPAPDPEPSHSGIQRGSWNDGRYDYDDEDQEAAPGTGRRARILVALLFLILAAIASAASYELWKVTRDPRWVPISFDARPSAGELVLSWDATAPVVASAARGILAVTGGRNPAEIQLSREQVHRGSYSYPSADLDVRFQLRLYDNESAVAADSLRVVRLPNPAQVTAAVPANPPPVSLEQSRAASPPEIRHEVQPLISPGIRRRIVARTMVSVVVQVDKSGHVTGATSKANGRGLERYLAGEAVKAARKWSFSPARSKDGSPVAATQVISFEFTPPVQ